MNHRLEELLEKFNPSEADLPAEFHRKENEFDYEVRDKKVHFKENVRGRHVLLAKKLGRLARIESFELADHTGDFVLHHSDQPCGLLGQRLPVGVFCFLRHSEGLPHGLHHP